MEAKQILEQTKQEIKMDQMIQKDSIRQRLLQRKKKRDANKSGIIDLDNE